MMKFKKFLAAAMTGAMMLGVVTTAVPAVSVYAADAKVVSVRIKGSDVVAPSGTGTYYAVPVMEIGGEEAPAVTWAVEGAKDTNTKFGESGVLTVGEDETAEKLTVKATCGTASASMEVIVGTGASMIINYYNMTADITTNGDDSFLALEVLKDSEGTKAGTTYWYEAEEDEEGNVKVRVDLSFLKLSKEGWVRVFGDTNSTPLKIYTVAAQVTKPSVKYVAGKDTLEDSFTLKNAELETLRWKTLYGEGWSDFSDLEGELDNLTIAGTTLLVRSVDKDDAAPASAEVKVKIAACPKAPKVTVDYAKNTIKLPKSSEIRVPDPKWVIPAESKDEGAETFSDVSTPFYFKVGTNKDDLNVAPTTLATKLIDKFIADYNAAQGKLTDKTLQTKYPALTTEDKKDEDGKITEKSDRTKYIEEFEEGYSILVRTEKGKKAASQPTFVEVKKAPEIQIRQKEETVGEEKVKVDENVIVVMDAPDADGNPVYTTNTLTYTYSDTELKLTPATKNGVTYSYSLDGGEKFTKLSKETAVKLAKIDSSKGVIVRTEGTKEDAKKDIIGNWASNEITLPVAVGTITISGDKEVTAGTTDVTKTYTVAVKDALGTELKDAKVTWSATGTTENVTFDADTQKLTVKSGATAGKVTISVTCGGKTETLEVEIKAAPTTPAA